MPKRKPGTYACINLAVQPGILKQTENYIDFVLDDYRTYDLLKAIEQGLQGITAYWVPLTIAFKNCKSFFIKNTTAGRHHTVPSGGS